MKDINSIEQIDSLMIKMKEKVKRPITNSLLDAKAMERYIRLKRLYYEYSHSAMNFFTDEDRYYNLFFYIDPSEVFKIEKKEKPVLARIYYKKENDRLVVMRNGLKANGFIKKSKIMQIQKDLISRSAKTENILKRAKDLVIRSGYHVNKAAIQEHHKIQRLIDETKELKYYQYEYATREEIEKAYDRGEYMCITDNAGEVLAVSICTVKNGIAYGNGIAVKEDYKKMGFPLAMCGERYLWLDEMKVKYLRGWILEDNFDSIQYHSKLEYRFTGYIGEEWILEP